MLVLAAVSHVPVVGPGVRLDPGDPVAHLPGLEKPAAIRRDRADPYLHRHVAEEPLGEVPGPLRDDQRADAPRVEVAGLVEVPVERGPEVRLRLVVDHDLPPGEPPERLGHVPVLLLERAVVVERDRRAVVEEPAAGLVGHGELAE